MPNIDEELDQKSPDPRFDPDDPKVDEPERDLDLRDDDEEREAGRGVMRNPGQDVDEEELAEEDILEQRDIDDAAKGEGPDA